MADTSKPPLRDHVHKTVAREMLSFANRTGLEQVIANLSTSPSFTVDNVGHGIHFRGKKYLITDRKGNKLSNTRTELSHTQPTGLVQLLHGQGPVEYNTLEQPAPVFKTQRRTFTKLFTKLANGHNTVSLPHSYDKDTVQPRIDQFDLENEVRLSMTLYDPHDEEPVVTVDVTENDGLRVEPDIAVTYQNVNDTAARTYMTRQIKRYMTGDRVTEPTTIPSPVMTKDALYENGEGETASLSFTEDKTLCAHVDKRVLEFGYDPSQNTFYPVE